MARGFSRLASRLLPGVLVSAGMALSAAAQVVDVEDVATEPSKEAYTINGGWDYMAKTSVKHQTNFSRGDFRAGVGGKWDLADHLSLDTRFSYQLNSYKFTNDGYPFDWSNINNYTLLGLLNWQLDDKWSLLGGPLIRYSGEGSADWKHSASYGGLLGFNWLSSKDLSLGLAVGVVSQIEDKAGIVPIPMIRWHFADDFTLRTGVIPLGGRMGLGPELTYNFAKDFDLSVGAQYQRSRYRLNDHAANAQGIGEDTSLPIYAKFAWRPVEAASVELFAGVVAGGGLKTQDQDGNHAFDHHYDTAPTVGMRGEYRF
jgi:hypothetical protein